MSHRHIAFGVASTGIALAFVMLVKLFRRGKKKSKPDGNVVRKPKARQGTRSPAGQARSGKARRVQPHQSASADPDTAAVAQAGSGHGTVKRRVKPRSPKPAAPGSAAGTGATQRPSSRSQIPVATATGAASHKRALKHGLATEGQEAGAVPVAPATPGAAGQTPVAEHTSTTASSSLSTPNNETSEMVSVLQEGSLPPVAPPAKQETDAGPPRGIVAAIAAEVQSSEMANSVSTQGVLSAPTEEGATPEGTLAPAPISTMENSAAPAAAVDEIEAPAAPAVASTTPNRTAVSSAVPESESTAAPVAIDANGGQPAGAAEAAAAVTVEPSESVSGLATATAPPVLLAAGQSSQDTEAAAAVSPAASLPDQASVAGAEPVAAPSAVEAADTPSKRAAVSDTPSKSAAAASVPSKGSGSTPSRVTMSPAVEAAEEQRSNSKQRLTVADIIRESIKLKQKNERLKQQLNLKSERRSRSGSSSSSSRTNGASSSRSSSVVPASAAAAAATADASAADIPSQQEQDQAGNESTPPQPPPSSTSAITQAESAGANEPAAPAVVRSSQPEASNGTAGGSINGEPSSSSGNGTSSTGGARRSERECRGPSLSAADLMREMAGIKTENMELVKLLATQLAEVRQQNAELMAAFHRREQLAAVREEAEGERSSKGTGQAGAGMAATDGGSTPNTGSELGTFKDRLHPPGFGRAPGSAAGSDAGSSLRSAPAGLGGSTPSRGLWKWATGGRRAGGAMTADNVSLPDSMASPRSNISVPVETLVDLLDWAAR